MVFDFPFLFKNAEEADKVATRLLMPHLSDVFPDKTK